MVFLLYVDRVYIFLAVCGLHPQDYGNKKRGRVLALSRSLRPAGCALWLHPMSQWNLKQVRGRVLCAPPSIGKFTRSGTLPFPILRILLPLIFDKVIKLVSEMFFGVLV